MKRAISLALALAMLLTMSAVAFAADETVYFLYNNYGKEKSSKVYLGEQKIGYGDSAFFLITEMGKGPLTAYDQVKGMKVKAQWTQNGDMVESVTIIKKKVYDYDFACYFIAVKVKDKDTTAQTEIAGKMEVTMKDVKFFTPNIPIFTRMPSAERMPHFTPDKTGVINPFITVGYDKAAGGKGEAQLDDDNELYEFGDDKNCSEDEEFEFSLYGGAGTFTVDTNGQGKILLSSSVKYNEGLEELYPDANYVYITGNGKSFNKTGTMLLKGEEGNVLYQLKNGKLVKMNVEYDSYEEGFVFKTRTLGTYIIAEEELDLSVQNKPAEAPTVEAAKPVNPTTGGAC